MLINSLINVGLACPEGIDLDYVWLYTGKRLSIERVYTEAGTYISSFLQK